MAEGVNRRRRTQISPKRPHIPPRYLWLQYRGVGRDLEFLIDREEDRTLRAVLVGTLREAER